jgi:hypothetical protein
MSVHHNQSGDDQMRDGMRHLGWRVTLLLAVLAVAIRPCRAKSAVCLSGHVYEFDTEVGLNYAKAKKYATSRVRCGRKVRALVMDGTLLRGS